MISFQKVILILGLFVFSLAFVGMVTQWSSMVWLFIVCFPGFLLGFITALFKKSTNIQRVLFFFTSGLLYFLTIYLIEIGTIEKNLAPLKILLASSVNAVILQILFDLIFKEKILLLYSFKKPFIFGLIASVIPTIAAFSQERYWILHWTHVFIWAGLFSIFPLWFFFFAKNLVVSHKISERLSFL